jgi:hypothetical protein
MHVAVDQPGSTKCCAQVDDLGLFQTEVGGTEMAVADLRDALAAHQDGRRAARPLAGPVEQLAGLDDAPGAGVVRREDVARRRENQDWNEEKSRHHVGGLRCTRPLPYPLGRAAGNAGPR